MNIEIKIPETLAEVTLGQYQKFLKIQEGATDEKFLQVKMIEIFCNVPADVVLKMKLSDTNEIIGMLNEMFKENQSLVKRTKLNGKEYGFIPNLEDISLGEYVDLDTYISDWDNMHITMNVLYRPIKSKYGERYSIEDYQTSDSLHMKDLTMDCVYGALLFFYRLGSDLSIAILNYLKEGKEKRLVQYLSSEANGDGINQFTHSLEATLRDLKTSLN